MATASKNAAVVETTVQADPSAYITPQIRWTRKTYLPKPGKPAIQQHFVDCDSVTMIAEGREVPADALTTLRIVSMLKAFRFGASVPADEVALKIRLNAALEQELGSLLGDRGMACQIVRTRTMHQVVDGDTGEITWVYPQA